MGESECDGETVKDCDFCKGIIDEGHRSYVIGGEDKQGEYQTQDMCADCYDKLTENNPK